MEGSGIADVVQLRLGRDPLDQAGEDLAGPELDELVDTLVGQMRSDGLGGLGQRRLMQDRHLVPATEQLTELAEQAGPHDHRIRRIDGDLDGHRR